MILKTKAMLFSIAEIWEITSVYMLIEMLILISLYMKTCSIALVLVFANLRSHYLLFTLNVVKNLTNSPKPQITPLWKLLDRK